MTTQKKLKVVFCGTPDIALPCLKFLHKHPAISLELVVSQPDRPAGRGNKLNTPPVAQFAQENSLPLVQTENLNKEDQLLKSLEQKDIDLFIVFAFSQFLSSRVLKLPKLGCFNIHTSLLPKYRGAAPIQHALLNGETKTGIAIQKMVKKMDAGPLAVLSEVSISTEETGGELYQKLKVLAPIALNSLLDKITSEQLQLSPQDETQVSFAPELKKEQGLIHFKLEKCDFIINKIRAFDPWPGTYCFLGSKRLKVLKAVKNNFHLSPGQVHTKYGQLVIGCIDGSLRLSKVQLEGKAACTDEELLRGMREQVVINPEL